LPLGARWSLDAVLRGPLPGMPRRVCDIGTIGYVVQVTVIYFFAALSKSGADWRTDGTAVQYALSLGQFSTPLGEWLRSMPALTHLLTPAVWWLELIGPLVLLAPFWTTRLRSIAILGFVGLQVGFGLTLANLGLFPAISCIVLLGLLPSGFWDRLGASHLPHALFAAAGPTARSALARRVVGRWPGMDSPCQLNPLLTVGAALCLLYVVLINVGGLPASLYRLPNKVASAGKLLGLDQRWDMFSPTIPRRSGWYVIPGTLRNGQQVDLYTNTSEMHWERPPSIAGTYPNHRWMKYMEAVGGQQTPWMLPLFGEYLCDRWNQTHGDAEQVLELQTIYMAVVTQPDYQYTAPRPREIFRHQCSRAVADHLAVVQ
jgi:hypothetical protein